MKIVLASASPRRKELLKMIVSDFECVSPNVDEESYTGFAPKEKALFLSKEKCKTIVMTHSSPQDVIIASDTVVEAGGNLLEKPKTETEAYQMIKMLAGNVHQVHTAVTVAKNGIIYSFVDTTKVYMQDIPDKTIKKYIQTAEPYDKAGGYAIQGFIGAYVTKINGNYHNVVGLPVCRLNQLLKAIKVL